MQTTAVVNQKGGVGKTATTLNVAGALAEAGAKVLVVDLDPQGHLTAALQLEPGSQPATLEAALLGAYSPDAALVRPHSERLAVLPNSIGMFTVSRELEQVRAREERLARTLSSLAADYDHCLIDCPPALDILTDNALTAADGVLIPVQAEDSSLRALHLLLAQIQALEAELRRPQLTLHGLVLSMVDRGTGGRPRSNVGRSVLTELDQLPLPIQATVPRGAVVTEAWRVGQPVVTYAPTSEHATVYRTLAEALDKDTA
ncbi:MAG: ParA family protein [Nocardioidaceae bacterium]